MKTTAKSDTQPIADATAPEPELIVRAIMADVDAHALPSEQIAETDPQSAEEAIGPVRGLLGRLLGYRPSASILGWLIAILFLIAVPGLVLFVALLGFATLAVTYFTLGHDRFVEKLGALCYRLETHSPGSAKRLRDFHSRTSQRLSRILPEKLAFEMGLPDPDPAPLHPKLAQDPFDRLARDAASADLQV